MRIYFLINFAPVKNDFVAQLVEQLTLNQWVEGSSPSEVTKKFQFSLELFFCDTKRALGTALFFLITQKLPDNLSL